MLSAMHSQTEVRWDGRDIIAEEHTSQYRAQVMIVIPYLLVVFVGPVEEHQEPVSVWTSKPGEATRRVYGICRYVFPAVYGGRNLKVGFGESSNNKSKYQRLRKSTGGPG
jgi:hypothetical protein